MAWLRVTRPMHLGGLGVHDLQVMAGALRMRWLWLEKTQPDRPWGLLHANIPEPARLMFMISVTTTLGDGTTMLFWTDRWVNGQPISDLALELMPFVSRRGWRNRSVRDALQQNEWQRDIVGGLPVMATWQLLQLCDIVGEINLDPNTPDQHIWTASPTGELSSKSTYERFFAGAIPYEPYRQLWCSWAPLKAKLFLWLASWNRCWTADRLQRRGLPHPDKCPLCDQQAETIDHMLHGCVFAREIWTGVLQWIGKAGLAPQNQTGSFQQW